MQLKTASVSISDTEAALMFMAMCTMHMFMGNLFWRGWANRCHRAGEIQCHACKGMIPVDSDGIVSDLYNFVDNYLIRVFCSPLKMHANSHIIRKRTARL